MSNMVTERFPTVEVSPEFIYDVLKNREGWFCSDYDGCVDICFNRPETTEERVQRENVEAQKRAFRDELLRQEARERAERDRIRAARNREFKAWRATVPEFQEFIALKKQIHRGPLMEQDHYRMKTLYDTYGTGRARENFYRFMGWVDNT